MGLQEIQKLLVVMQNERPNAYLDFYEVLAKTDYSKDELDKILRDYQTVKFIEVYDYADNVPSKFKIRK